MSVSRGNFYGRYVTEAGETVSQTIDWREVLVRYMRHVGDCEGVFFAGFPFDPGIIQELWEQVISDAAQDAP